MPKNLIEQVLKTVRNYDMLKPHDAVLVAVSGGPDSVFLLHVMKELKNKLKLGKISVCTLDHGLRGKESAGDAAFVKKISKKMGFDVITKKINLKNTKHHKLSTEEAAREERYKFFREALKRSGSNVVATGHTLDDQAETMLIRLVKGASLKGMAGISPVREEKNFRVIRPLLEIEKEEIEEYLEEKNIPYRTDRTNTEPIYFRNIVRREMIPFLEKYNPRLKRVLANLAGHLREDLEFIETEKTKAAKGMSRAKDGILMISLKDIIVQPRAIQKEILRDCLDKAGGLVKKLSFRHWKELDNLIRSKRTNSSIDLPGSIRITRTVNALIFSRI